MSNSTVGAPENFGDVSLLEELDIWGFLVELLWCPMDVLITPLWQIVLDAKNIFMETPRNILHLLQHISSFSTVIEIGELFISWVSSLSALLTKILVQVPLLFSGFFQSLSVCLAYKISKRMASIIFTLVNCFFKLAGELITYLAHKIYDTL